MPPQLFKPLTRPPHLILSPPAGGASPPVRMVLVCKATIDPTGQRTGVPRVEGEQWYMTPEPESRATRILKDHGLLRLEFVPRGTVTMEQRKHLVEDGLRHGITVIGDDSRPRRYQPLGVSTSSLEAGELICIRGNEPTAVADFKKKAGDPLAAYFDFDGAYAPCARAFELLLRPSLETSVKIDNGSILSLNDTFVEVPSSCGIVRRSIAATILESLRELENIPSVLGLQHGGWSGLFEVWPDTKFGELSDATGKKIAVRNSMRVFPTENAIYPVELVDDSSVKPVYLDEYMALRLLISQQPVEQMVRATDNLINSISHCDRKGVYGIVDAIPDQRYEGALRKSILDLLSAGHELADYRVASEVRRLQERIKNSMMSYGLKVPVLNSAEVLTIVAPPGTLQRGEACIQLEGD
ncbi:hypothetical protein HMN09_01173600 [Mycena chlorophos]|uniref:RNA-dependent RNA polymerase n=1 Tax=Mycena chlorophos TaxID=658473 RepID=A0A8H6S7F2_MYCCL|nr:hypothetical protein HMN09_01173600 [Mycena chlorophos]